MYVYLSFLAVQKVVSLKTWLKNELYKVGNKTWKGEVLFQCQKIVLPKQIWEKMAGENKENDQD